MLDLEITAILTQFNFQCELRTIAFSSTSNIDRFLDVSDGFIGRSSCFFQ